MAAQPLGLRAIHGVEMDLQDGRHVTLLVENTAGWRNLCRIVTRAHRDDRAKHEPPPAVPLETLEEHAEGLVCLSGCADHGVHDEPTLRRLKAAFGEDHLRVELQRPFQRHDRARNRELAQLAQRLGVPTVATGNVHTHARTRAPLQDAFVALRHHLTLDSSEPVRRGNTAHVLASPQAMAARFEGHPKAVAETRELADRLRFDLTQDLGYRYPGAEDQQAPRMLAELCWVMLAERYPPGTAQSRRRARSPQRRAAGDRHARARRLLPPASRPAGARARGRGGGARAVERAAAAAAGPRPRVLGVLDRLLPHGPLAHRPDRQRPVPRALSERGAQRAAGHRPGLPARRARGADPARARALRHAALGARGGVPDVPIKRRRPRARQGARACRRGSSSASRAAPSRGRSRAWGATWKWRWA